MSNSFLKNMDHDKLISKFAELTIPGVDFASDLIKKLDLYEKGCNPDGKGFNNQLELKTIKGDKVVLDHTTGLIWQQSGSSMRMNWKESLEYRDNANLQIFGGISDWNFPNLLEAMSLMKKGENDNINIDNIFDIKQIEIWTGTMYIIDSNNFHYWYVSYQKATCWSKKFDKDSESYVRLVSRIPSKEEFLETGIRRANIDLIHESLLMGTDINLKLDDEGKNALMITLQSALSDSERIKIFNILIESGADVNSQDNKGYTPLMYAIINWRKEFSETLVEADADVNMRNSKGETALHLCVKEEELEIAQILIDAGANPYIKDKKNKSPIDLALKNELDDFIEIFNSGGIVSKIVSKFKAGL